MAKQAEHDDDDDRKLAFGKRRGVGGKAIHVGRQRRPTAVSFHAETCVNLFSK